MDTVQIFTDGATLGPNGKLGTVKTVGLGVYFSTGEKYAEPADGISNNEAEFKALLLGMRVALHKGIKRVNFNLDSNLVVRRANGLRPKKAKFKNERMDNFQDEVLELKSMFESCSFVWIPREQNTLADYLSKKALTRLR
jgi:ribonuclease HI